MTPFSELWSIAAARKGGDAALEALLPVPKPRAEIAAIPDDRWLAGMARHVFNAGFSWQVVESKWPGFEAAFHGFDPGRNALMSDADLDRLLKDARIVRNAAKILSVRDNAVLVCDLARAHGSAGRFFADWPASDYVGLLDVLKTRGSRLGGATGTFVLRWQGVDGFMLGGDVVAALIREGVVDKVPTSKKALAAVQAAFNAWAEESGRPLMQISRTLACTVDSPPPPGH